MSEIIDLTNTDLGYENLGETWGDFMLRCTPIHAKLFNDAYNLIAISFPDSTLDIDLTNLIIDESLETSEAINLVRIYFIDLYVDALTLMGISIDKENIDLNDLQTLVHILDTIYMADGLTDLLGLVDIIKDEDMDTVSRFVSIVTKVNPQYSFEKIEEVISDVSSNTLKGLLVGLNIIDEDDEEYVDPSITKRIKNNKTFLIGKLGGTHILNEGGLGQPIDNYFNLFISELGAAIGKDTSAYLSETLSLMLISSLTDKQILVQFNDIVENMSDDINSVYIGNKILDQVILDE